MLFAGHDCSKLLAQTTNTPPPATQTSRNSRLRLEDRADAGMGGNYITLEKEFLGTRKTGTTARGYRIERRVFGSGTTWQFLTDVESPKDSLEFRARLVQAYKPFQGLFSLDEIPVSQIWKRYERVSVLDSVGMWGNAIIVRQALGVAYQDTTALAATPYEYRVSKLMNSGEAAMLFVTNQVLGITPPTLASLKFASARCDRRSAVLQWTTNGLPRPFGVLLYRRENLSGDFQRVPATVSLSGSLDATTYRLEDTTIRYGAIYQYYLVPFNAYALLGTASDTTLVSTVPFNEASFVQDLRASTTNGGIRVTWRLLSPENLAGLELWRSQDFNGTFERIVSVSPRDSSYTDRSVKEIDRYWYYVIRRGLLGEVSPPSIKVYGIYEDPSKPPRPFIAESEATTKGNLLSIGSTRPNLRGYRIWRSDGYGKEMLPITGVIPPDDSTGFATFLDTARSLLATHSYGYAVQAETRSHQTSDFSDTVYLRPNKPLPPPATPMNLVALPRRFPTDSAETRASAQRDAVELFWDNMQESDALVQQYRVFRRVVSSNASGSNDGNTNNAFTLLADSLGGQQNYYTDTTVTASTQYEYAVKSVAANAESAMSAVARASVPSNAVELSPPSGVRALPTSNGVEIRWGMVVGNEIEGFAVYRYQRDGEPKRISLVTTSQRSFFDALPKRGELYFYYVTVIDKQQRESPPSREVSIRH
jgi:hypothetical protein